MIDIAKLIKTSNIFDIEEFESKALNIFYSRKYGSIEEATKVFNQLRLECNSEEEFLIKKENKIQSDIPLEQFKFLMNFIQSLQSFLTIVNREQIENSLINNVQNNPEKWKLVLDIMEDLTYLINQKLSSNKQLIKERLILEFNSKITFTIKENREELGFKNQRTFKKWLNYFFGNKYDNSRKFNLLEYIEILKKFILKPDENTIDLNNMIDEYKNVCLMV